MIALFLLAGLVFILTVFLTVRACLKLKTKTKSISEIAEDGARVKTRLERYTENLPEDEGRCA
jgi:hypothetical protein